jgi:hypothetical protein
MTIPFLNIKPKSVKLKVSPRFPAQLLGGAGIDVARSNGNFTVSLDYTDFPQIPALPLDATYALIYDSVTGKYSQIPTSLFGGSGVAPANPAVSIGLTVLNGIAPTFMRSDAAPPLSQAIAPTWTSTHNFLAGTSTFLTGGTTTIGSAHITAIPDTSKIALNDVIVGVGIPIGSTVISVDSTSQVTASANATVSGATAFVFGPANSMVSYFPAGNSPALMQQAFAGAAGSSGAPDIFRHTYMRSNLGYSGRASNYKIGDVVFLDIVADTSANGYCRNDILNITHGSVPASGFFATGYEIDINQNSGVNVAASTNFGTQTAVYGLASVLGSGTLTANYWATGLVSGSFAGFAATGNFVAANGAGFYDASNSSNILLGSGTHSNGVNLFTTALTGGLGSAFISPNNVGFGSANAAGGATIPLVYLDGTNSVQHGSTSVVKHNFNVNPGGGTPAAAVVNSHATAGDIVVQLQGGAATAVDTTTLYLNFVNPANSIQRGQVNANDSAGVGHVAYTISSDQRLKRDLGEFRDALERLMAVKVHRYQGINYNGDDYSVGYFAQELHEIFPWAVIPSRHEDYQANPWAVDYGRITPLIIAGFQQAMKAKDQQIAALEKRLAELERRMRI